MQAAARFFSSLVATFAVSAGAVSAQQSEQAPEVIAAVTGDVRVERLATLEFPWGMAMLPDGKVLITEKPGRLRIWDQGALSEPVRGVPNVVHRAGRRDQGGLLDVAVDPDFASNGMVYLSFVEAAEQQPSGARDTDDFRFPRLDLTDNLVRGGAVARGRLEGTELRDVQVIWRQTPKTLGRGHFGNRLVFAPDGKLYITSGDRMRFEPAEDLSSNLGKVVRINPDGSIPQDNPFVGKDNARTDIWSYGHRNILAAAIDPNSRLLWAVEMGPLGGDELNLIRPGHNYGWPLVSNGDHYVRPSHPDAEVAIPGHPTSKAFDAPIRTWTPVISPSGAMFYSGTQFPEWRGSMLIGGLTAEGLVRLAIDGERVALEERIDMKRRIRDLLEAPDGSILAIVDDAKGDLLRLTSASRSTQAAR